MWRKLGQRRRAAGGIQTFYVLYSTKDATTRQFTSLNIFGRITFSVSYGGTLWLKPVTNSVDQKVISKTFVASSRAMSQLNVKSILRPIPTMRFSMLYIVKLNLGFYLKSEHDNGGN